MALVDFTSSGQMQIPADGADNVSVMANAVTRADALIGRTNTISMTGSGDFTAILDQIRFRNIVFSGSPSGTRNFIIPVNLDDTPINTPFDKNFVNPTGQDIVVKYSTGTTQTVKAGTQAHLYGDSTNINFISGATTTGTPVYPSQVANTILAAPDGSAGVPGFRTIVIGDLAGVVDSNAGLTTNDNAHFPTTAAARLYVAAQIAALVNSSPATLDTLKELADALGDDPNFATTMTTALAGKQPLDAMLTALAALTTVADRGLYFTGVDAPALFTLTTFIRTLLDDADAAAARATLDVPSNADLLGAVGDVESDLSDHTANTTTAHGAVVAATANKHVVRSGTGTAKFVAGAAAGDAIVYGQNAAGALNTSATDKLLGRSTAGAGAVEEIALTAAGRALIDDADAAAQRVTMAAATYPTNADITSLTALLTAYLTETSEPATPAANIVALWVEDDNGLSRLRYKDDAGNVFTLARDALLLVKNTTGGTLSKGTPCYLNGAASGIGTVAKSKTDALATTVETGLIFADIANNGFGFLLKQGKLSNFDTSALTAGASAYVSAATAGLLTSTQPAPPNFSQATCFCLTSHATTGSVNVFPRTASVDAQMDIHSSAQGKPLASVQVLRYTVTRPCTLPVSCAGSQASCGTAATASTTFDVQKNGSSIATFNFATSASVATFTNAGADAFVAGDILTVLAPGTPDATLANMDVTLVVTLT